MYSTNSATDAGSARALRPASKSHAKQSDSTMADPMAGKYQNRSARTVGKTTGMFETGKYEMTIHIRQKAMSGAGANRRITSTGAASAAVRNGPASGSAALADRLQRSQDTRPTTGAATRGKRSAE